MTVAQLVETIQGVQTATLQQFVPMPAIIQCLEFETLPPGAQYPCGSSFTEANVTVVAEPFQWEGGQWTTSGHAEVASLGAAGGSGQELVVNNVTLGFYFGGPVNNLELRFGEFGGNLNVRINGVFQNINNFIDIDGTTIGGVYVASHNGYGNDQGLLRLTGPLHSFAVGGQELVIDAVCTTC
ncbi:hypothetical protein KFU94_28575 [Chloroflexi bacterium TSY]|nr:hypothetical protein [Chloroflexi bacterium TSY]